MLLYNAPCPQYDALPISQWWQIIDRDLLLSVRAVTMADAGSPSVDSSKNEASDTHSSAGTTQFRFSEEQKKTLMEYWEKGMQTCSRSRATMIEECATTAGCTAEQVKVS